MAAELMVSNVLWSSFTISIINLQEDYTGDYRFVEWTLFKVNEDNNNYELKEIRKLTDWLDNAISNFSREIKDLIPETKYIVYAKISNLSNTFQIDLATGEIETDSLPPSVEESKRPKINGPNLQSFINNDLEKRVAWNITINNIKYKYCTLHFTLGQYQLAHQEGYSDNQNWSMNVSDEEFLDSSEIPSGRYRWTIEVIVKENEYSTPVVFKKSGYFCWFAFGKIDAIWEEGKTLYIDNYKHRVVCSIYPIVDRQLFFEIMKEVNSIWEDGSIDILDKYINKEKKISVELFRYIYEEVLKEPFPDIFPFYENETNNCFYNLQQILRSCVG